MQLINLRTDFLGRECEFFEQLDSTQAYIWRMIENNTIKNNLLITYYFISKKKVKIKYDKITLSESEKKHNFKLIQVSPTEIMQLLENNNTLNPRAVYYKEELEEIIKRLKIK